MLSEIEQARLRLSKDTDAKKKSQLGQFLTPAATAAFMAGLFSPADGICRLLDAGAGIGSLSAAFLERWRCGDLRFQRVELDAFEIDNSLHAGLAQTLSKYRNASLAAKLHAGDFIHAAVDALSADLFSGPLPKYTHAILNPPYKKINSDSTHRRALRRVGIETVNLYSAFVALAVALTASGGQIVAIVPRSFCNGPYYRPFRNFILAHTAIQDIHLFESRSKAFKDDAVLQENVIIRLERDGRQGPVTVSSSSDATFCDLVKHAHPFERIVFPDDPERFIHVPTSSDTCALERVPAIHYKLADLGMQVSTGPVVDFRVREHLRGMPTPGSVPLLYPGHFVGGKAKWPVEGTQKPNAIARNDATEKWLYPSGFYCVVRRLSSKEETRRIVASVVEPGAFNGAGMLGFENHLNVFHCSRLGLPQALAHGLALFLNTSAVDEAFRRFNGHTQVNATDLALMKYPSCAVLTQLGEWAMQQPSLTQSLIDAQFGALAK